jgi:hypothetical protein
MATSRASDNPDGGYVIGLAALTSSTTVVLGLT